MNTKSGTFIFRTNPFTISSVPETKLTVLNLLSLESPIAYALGLSRFPNDTAVCFAPANMLKQHIAELRENALIGPDQHTQETQVALAEITSIQKAALNGNLCSWTHRGVEFIYSKTSDLIVLISNQGQVDVFKVNQLEAAKGSN
jgi:hypothetical protein